MVVVALGRYLDTQKGLHIGDGKSGRLTLRLQKIYEDVVHGGMAQYRQWLEPCYHPAAHSAGAA